MKNILELSKHNTKTAFRIIKELNIENIYKEMNYKVNLIGSLKMGLLMKNKDIDFHIYSYNLDIEKSFNAISKIANNKKIKNIVYKNLIDTEEHCIEWHLYYKDDDNSIWQIDIIDILKNSYYDGYFEKISDDIINMLTKEKRNIILKLKYETPDDIKIMGIEYYKAVLKDNIESFDEFMIWRKNQNFNNIIEF